MRMLALTALVLGVADAFISPNSPIPNKHSIKMSLCGTPLHRGSQVPRLAMLANAYKNIIAMPFRIESKVVAGLIYGARDLRSCNYKYVDHHAPIVSVSLSKQTVGEGETRSERAMRILRDIISGLPKTGGYQSMSDLFLDLDKDSSGGIDINELKQAFRQMGAALNDDQMKDILHLMDVSKDGLVDWNEFQAAMEIAEAQLMEDLDDNEVMNDDEY